MTEWLDPFQTQKDHLFSFFSGLVLDWQWPRNIVWGIFITICLSATGIIAPLLGLSEDVDSPAPFPQGCSSNFVPVEDGTPLLVPRRTPLSTMFGGGHLPFYWTLMEMALWSFWLRMPLCSTFWCCGGHCLVICHAEDASLPPHPFRISLCPPARLRTSSGSIGSAKDFALAFGSA